MWQVGDVPHNCRPALQAVAALQPFGDPVGDGDHSVAAANQQTLDRRRQPGPGRLAVRDADGVLVGVIDEPGAAQAGGQIAGDQRGDVVGVDDVGPLGPGAPGDRAEGDRSARASAAAGASRPAAWRSATGSRRGPRPHRRSAGVRRRRRAPRRPGLRPRGGPVRRGQLSCEAGWLPAPQLRAFPYVLPLHASAHRPPRPRGHDRPCLSSGVTGRREIYLGPFDLPRGRRQLPHGTGSLLGLPDLQAGGRRQLPVPDSLGHRRPLPAREPAGPQRPGLPLADLRRLRRPAGGPVRDQPRGPCPGNAPVGERRPLARLGPHQPAGLRGLHVRDQQALPEHPPLG